MTQLVSATTYIEITGDGDAAGDLDAALARAQARAERECRRPFSYGQYSETVFVYPDGCASPSVTPLASIDSPADTFLQGNRVFLGYLTPSPYLIGGEWTNAFPPQAAITYTGGWTADTLPEDLAEAICRIGFRMLHPVLLPQIPAGATSAAVGDVHLQSAVPLDGFAVIDGGTAQVLQRYRRRQVRGWQSTPVLVT